MKSLCTFACGIARRVNAGQRSRPKKSRGRAKGQANMAKLDGLRKANRTGEGEPVSTVSKVISDSCGSDFVDVYV
jgi:hypothetical protein